ncbi:MAG: acetate--CoA ligase family protein [Anaerolineae bacterium]|nr:acetate--CoA ligase family protein [Anaerolineae bacterium]
MTSDLKPFFAPSGVALIGTSANPTKLSFGILRNMVEGEYRGGVYPVNPRHSEVLGKPCFADISSVPDPVDLAVIALPAPSVPETVEACGQRGIKTAIIISGGFREVGPQGLELENRCVKIARRYKMRIIGPNCVGIMDLYSGVNTTFIKGVPPKGNIGFLSQSGAICGAVVDYVLDKDIGFSNFTSMGNMADVNETDIIEYLSVDPNTKVIAAYLEGIKDGQRFLEVARKVSRIKPIVMLKVGRSEAGARAVSSHTGSLAGSHTAYQAAFEQTGIIEVESAAELFDVCIGMVYQRPPKGNRTVIVTNSGGPAALASDSLAANGMRLADLTPETQAFLRSKLNPAAQVGNPVDMLGGAEPQEYADALKACLADENVDATLAILTPQALVNPADVGKVIGEIAAQTDKTVITSFVGGVSVSEARHVLHGMQVPMYTFPEQAGKVMGVLRRFGAWRSKPEGSLVTAFKGIDQKAVQKILAETKNQPILGEAQTRPLLAAYSIPIVPGEWVQNADDAVQAAEKLGYPAALKIVSPDLLHKSEAGGIRLNLTDAASVKSAYGEMLSKIKKDHPQARLEGMLVEKMAPKGHEVIIGMRRDATFGPLVMFGLGGIYVELLTDVAFRIAPMTHQQALDMVNSTRAGKLLAGLRGQPAADIEAVIDCILRLGQLALDFPEISEIEINPLLVYESGKGVLALDARALR